MSDGPKFFDVMRPGRAHPPASSRPIIVGHTPSAQDTTLTDKPGKIVPKEYADEDSTGIDNLLDSHTKVNIEPANDGQQSAEVTNTSVQQTAAASTDVPPPEVTKLVSEADGLAELEADEKAVVSSQLSQTTNEQPAVSEEDPVQPAAQPPTVAPTPQEKAISADQTHTPESAEPTAEVEDELMQATIDTSQMVVSVHGRQRNWMRSMLLVVLAVVIVVAGFDLLLDAGHTTSSIPHTHFFGQ